MMTSHKSNCPSYKALIAVERKFCYEKLPMPAAQCVIPENIHTSTMEVIFLKTPLTPLKIPVQLQTFL